MLRKTILFSASFVLFSAKAFAQFAPSCPPGQVQVPANFCSEACIQCDLTGYSGSTLGYTSDGSNFCGTIENNQWVGFQASGATATFTATPINCLFGLGIQIALYTDCDLPPIECEGGNLGGGMNPVVMTAAMTPGVNYFLMIDGYGGDECTFNLTISPSSAVQGQPVGNNIGPIQGPSVLCPGATATYSIPPTAHAGAYTWTVPSGWQINGFAGPMVFSGLNGTDVQITAGPTPGTGFQICVEASNSCYPDKVSTCKTINVQSLPITTLVPDAICYEDAPYVLPWGVEVYTTGNYTTTVDSYQGCDSVLQKFITVRPPIFNNQGLKTLCKNECITVCGETFCDAGAHQVICQSYQGCDSTINFSIQYLEPLAQINGGGTITCNNPSILLTAEPAPSGTLFKWISLSGQVLGTADSFLVLNPGTYILSATLFSAGIQCKESDTITIQSNTIEPTLTAFGGNLNCLSSSFQLGAATNATNPGWAWAGPNGFSSSSANPSTQTAGTYTVTVTTGSNGCSATATTSVTGDLNPPILSTSGATLTCSLLSTQIAVNANPPGSGVIWNGPNGFSDTVQMPSVNQAGTYTVTVTNSINGCTATATTSVLLDNIPPGATADASGVIGCLTPTVTLIGEPVNPGNTFYWEGPGFTSVLENPEVTQAGTYTLTVMGSNGCTSTASTMVAGDTISPDAMTTGDTLNCYNPSTTIFSSTSVNNPEFNWSGPGGFSSTMQHLSNITAPGPYTLTVTALNGCTATAIAFIEEDFTAPDISALGGTISCNQSTVVLTGSSANPGASYFWEGPGGFESIQDTVSVNTVGDYVLLITGANGCTATAIALVDQDLDTATISVNTPDTLNCLVSSIVIQSTVSTAGSALQGLAWMGPNNFSASLSNPSVTAPGIYTLTATTLNGCTTSTSVFVDQDLTVPDGSAQGGTLDCAASSIYLNGQSNTPNVTYTWVGPNNFNANEEDPAVLFDGIYTLTITGANGCSTTAEALVLLDISPPSASATNTSIDCISGQATLSGSSTTSGVSYAWTGVNNFSSPLQNPLVFLEGQYLLTVTGANGCTATASATVLGNTMAPEVMIIGGSVLTCAIPFLSLQGVISTPGAIGVWTGPNNFNSNLDTITVSSPGMYTFTVTGPNGCIAVPNHTVLIDTLSPQGLTATGGQLDCNFPSISLNSSSTTNGLSFQWTGPGNYISTLPNPEVTNPGTYLLVVINPGNGCTSSATALVTQDPSQPSISVSADTLTCTNTSSILNTSSNNPDLSFLWTGPNGFNSNMEDPVVSVPGEYQLLVTAISNGCTASFNYTLIQNVTQPTLVAQGDTLSCMQNSGQISSFSNASGSTYSWSGPGGFSANVPNPSVVFAGTYTVVVSAGNGCTASATVAVALDENAPLVSATAGFLTCANSSTVLSASANIPVSWQWTGPGNFNSMEQNPIVSVPGTYIVAATAANGCISTFVLNVAADTQSPELNIQTPGALNCNTAVISLNATVTGTGPFNYMWTTTNGVIVSGANTLSPIVSQSGLYQLETSNSQNGCTTIVVVEVLSNDEVPDATNFQVQDVTCYGDSDGALFIGNISGGTAPYLYSVDNNPFSTNAVFTALAPGLHSLLVQDANGCESESSFEIFEPEELLVNLGPDTTIHLGTEILISLNSIVNFPDRVVQRILSPSNLPIDSSYAPTNSLRYQVTVIDTNGCQASDERLVLINKTRWVYIPNAILPTSLENTTITVFGGPEVEQIKTFMIFDRWGDLVYEASDFLKNDLSKGWNGTVRGKPVSPGVFVYFAEVLFKDGELVVFKGDITVVH